MADYRRLISYIYEYEGKQKGKNVGFAKLEARNGQCRINVNVKRIYMGGNAVGAYLLGTGGRETFLGNVFVRGGNGEFRATVDATNVEGTGVGLDTYFGLSVHDVKNSWRCYKTIWEDALAAEEGNTAENPVLSVPKFTAQMLPEAEKEMSPQAVSNVVKEIEAEIAKEEERREEEEKTAHAAELRDETQNAEECPPEPDETGVPGRSVSVENDDSSRQNKAELPKRPPLQEEESMSSETTQCDPKQPKENSVDNGMVYLSEESDDAEPKAQEEQPAEPEPPEPPKPEPSTQAAATVQMPEALKNAMQPKSPGRTAPRVNSQRPSPMVSPELENPEVLRYLQETEDLAADPEKLWEELKKTYPKIQPFEYEDGCDILTIRPQDIGKLPRECWVHGNNSFLLHGYYNFRYLILVKLGGNKKKARYLLGVPGHYYSSEKYMATMFGFPNFVLSRRQPVGDGRFGYWYTDLRIR